MQASRIEMSFFMGDILRVGWSFQCPDLVATTIGYTILGGETSTHFFIRYAPESNCLLRGACFMHGRFLSAGWDDNTAARSAPAAPLWTG